MVNKRWNNYEDKMKPSRQNTIMWITLIFMVLMAGIGWVLKVTNTNASQNNTMIIDRLTEHERILINLVEEKGKTRMELIFINSNLKRIENKIDKINKQ